MHQMLKLFSTAFLILLVGCKASPPLTPRNRIEYGKDGVEMWVTDAGFPCGALVPGGGDWTVAFTDYVNLPYKSFATKQEAVDYIETLKCTTKPQSPS